MHQPQTPPPGPFRSAAPAAPTPASRPLHARSKPAWRWGFVRAGGAGGLVLGLAAGLIVGTLAATLALAGALRPIPFQEGTLPGSIAQAPASQAQEAHALTTASSTASTVPLRVFATNGQLVGPVELPRVELTDEQWQQRLSPEAYRILRKAGTEAPFCGTLLDNKKEGVYACAGCGLPLFSSQAKFTSGTGWPSFFQPVATENIALREDRSHGMVRTEILCARCDGHLGHVFNDGPKPTGLRFCVNSESLTFAEAGELAKLAEVAVAYFAGGCFWCVEGVFEQLAGVLDVASGYSGGPLNPEQHPVTYKQVTTGATGHAETVRIIYDPDKITYEQLLEVHFATHDPTTLNRQGADVGTHYRSAIFYTTEQERQAAQAFIDRLSASGAYDAPIVTSLEPFNGFQIAEDYHQNYAQQNPDQPYICNVAMPKIQKARKLFADKLKQP